VVDADAVARAVVEPGTPALGQLVERFGAGILDADGRLDRAALAELAFANEESRAALEAITHPAINKEFMQRVVDAPEGSIVVCDVPLLVESKTAGSRGYQVVIVVEAPREARLTRLEDRGVPRADAEARMKAQATDEERRAVATHVIDNSGDKAALEQQVDAVWADLSERHAAQQAAGGRVDEGRHRGSVRSLGAALRARLRLRARGRSTGGD
jgi:dephospho-CoA kinase